METLVAYTDGSARPNPGYTGYGIHAYITDTNGKTKNVEDKYKATNKGYVNKKLFKKTNDIHEVGIYKIIDIYGYSKDSTTNNTAELDAIVKLFKFILSPNYQKLNDRFDNIVLFIDSTYVLDMLTKIVNNAKFPDKPANQSYIDELTKLVNAIRKLGKSIELNKIVGHSGHIGNEKADLLSNIGRNLNVNSTNIEDIRIIIANREEYYDMKVDREFEYSPKLLLFYSNNPDHYLRMLSYKGDTLKEVNKVGSRGSDISYILLDEYKTSPNIELIKSIINEINPDLSKAFVFKLDNIFKKSVWRNLILYGKDYLYTDRNIYDKILTLDNVDLAVEVYPPSLTYIAKETFNELVEFMSRYKSNDKLIIRRDITNLIYDDKKLKKEIINDKYIVKFKISNIIPYNKQLQLHFGIDLLKRNFMKKIEKKNPKVELLLEKYQDYSIYRIMISYDTDDKRDHILLYNKYSAVLYHTPKVLLNKKGK